MSIFDTLKKNKSQLEEPKNVTKVTYNITQAIQHHKVRIDNLTDEFETLSDKLKVLQSDVEKPKGVKNKEMDGIIFRMTIIKYEVDIRGDLLKWLCS